MLKAPTWGEWGLLEFVRGVVGDEEKDILYKDDIEGKYLCFEGGLRRFVYNEYGTTFRGTKYAVIDREGRKRELTSARKKGGFRLLRSVLLRRLGINETVDGSEEKITGEMEEALSAREVVKLSGGNRYHRHHPEVQIALFTRKKDAFRRHWEAPTSLLRRIRQFPNVHITRHDQMPKSFSSQARLFYNTDIVIGPHGAAMANTLFMKPHTHILEIWRCCMDNDLNERIARFPNLRLGWTSAFAPKLDINLKYLACKEEFDEQGRRVPELTKEQVEKGEGLCDVGKPYYSPYKYTTDDDVTFGKLAQAVLTFQGYQKSLAQKLDSRQGR